MSLFDSLGPVLDWKRCWSCDKEIPAPPIGFIEQTAYGWCCHRCLVELPQPEWLALLTVNELAAEMMA